MALPFNPPSLECCCICPQPLLWAASNSASKAFCVYVDPGTPPALPIAYLTQTEVWTPDAPSMAPCTYSGSTTVALTYDPTSDTGDCDISGSCGGVVEGAYSQTILCDSSNPDGPSYTVTCVRGFAYSGSSCGETNTLISQSNTFVSDCGGEVAPPGCTVAGNQCNPTDHKQATVTLSGGFDYITATQASLPGYGSFVKGQAVAYFDTNGFDTTITDIKYYLALPAPTPGCYKITWDEVTRDGVGTVVSTVHKHYTWDGAATQTPTNTLSAPTTINGGTISVENIVAVCMGC